MNECIPRGDCRRCPQKPGLVETSLLSCVHQHEVWCGSIFAIYHHGSHFSHGSLGAHTAIRKGEVGDALLPYMNFLEDSLLMLGGLMVYSSSSTSFVGKRDTSKEDAVNKYFIHVATGLQHTTRGHILSSTQARCS